MTSSDVSQLNVRMQRYQKSLKNETIMDVFSFVQWICWHVTAVAILAFWRYLEYKCSIEYLSKAESDLRVSKTEFIFLLAPKSGVTNKK